MKIHADDPIAKDIEVLDLKNGEFIRHCIWADDRTGQYEIYNSAVMCLTQGIFSTSLLFGKIVFVYKGV